MDSIKLKKGISTTWCPKVGIWRGPIWDSYMELSGGNSTYMVSTSHKLIIPTFSNCWESIGNKIDTLDARYCKIHLSVFTQCGRGKFQSSTIPPHCRKHDTSVCLVSSWIQLETAGTEFEGGTQTACFRFCACKCLAAVWSAHPPNCEIWSPHSHILHSSLLEAQLLNVGQWIVTNQLASAAVQPVLSMAANTISRSPRNSGMA